MWLGAAALAGAIVVGINPTRRGAELARDITHTDCQLIVTEAAYHAAARRPRPRAGRRPRARRRRHRLRVRRRCSRRTPGAPLPDVEVDESTLFLLLFTSGTTGAPKACICSQGRLAADARRCSAEHAAARPPTTSATMSMPLFHSNALIAGWSPVPSPAAPPACCAASSRRRASSPTCATYGVTYFNYVGKPLSYILATPEQPDDADNPLRIAFGNEAADLDIERFGERFGCTVIDGYGSTEGGAPHQPHARHAAGRARRRGRRGHRGPRPRDRRGVPPRALRRRRPAAQPRRGDRRDRQPRAAPPGSRATTRTTRRTRQRVRDGDLLDRRPRLPRRGRLLLLRRPRLRVAAGRRRELRRRAGRAHPRPPSRRRAGRGLRGARRRGRRPGDGRAPAAARAPTSTPTASPRSSPSSPTSARSGRPATSGSPTRCRSPRPARC